MITSKQLINLDIKQDKFFGELLEYLTSNEFNTDLNSNEIISHIKKILQNKDSYIKELLPIYKNFQKIIDILDTQKDFYASKVYTFTEKPYKIYGADNIESSAKQQMKLAMDLPITVTGALMSDAHTGYGIPIGGVLATDNVVIPYGVGNDIACRMRLTILNIDASYLTTHKRDLVEILKEHTRFGKTETFSNEILNHSCLKHPAWKEIKILKEIQNKAIQQLGTSGSGNHFVEFGEVDYIEFGLNKYLGILSHSGSRNIGSQIAQHYTKAAKNLHKDLPQEYKNLAWLPLDHELGIEYWKCMEVAGLYAAANHEIIHNKLVKALGISVKLTVENHHNFAWKEIHNGREVIVHRKGATPAGIGVLGIIPGSMATPGFIVKGKGNPESLNSASHGAGRAASRTKTFDQFSKKDLKEHLVSMGVTLIGGSVDEIPMGYKDINKVMLAQHDLVEIVGRFDPKIVRMDKE